jgi:cytochrome c-type biogenesis protein CcsB
MTTSLLSVDALLHLAAAVLYAIAFVAVVLGIVLELRLERLALASGCAALVAHAAGIAVRWAAVGHGPFVTRYENLSSYAFVAGLIGLAVAWRRPSLGSVRAVLYPAAFLMLGLGLYSGQEVANLPPTFTGVWLVLHVCFYFLAFGTALTATAASVLFMLEGRAPGSSARLGDADGLDMLAYRYAGLAFAFWGIGMLTGSIWANNAWGRYWGWDPVETWSLITWLLFGAYLHARRFYGWKGRKAAWLLVICFGLALMSLFGTSLITRSIHSVYFRS